MSDDFNAVHSSLLGAFYDSGFNARGNRPFTIRYWNKGFVPYGPAGPSSSYTYHIRRRTNVGAFAWGLGRRFAVGNYTINYYVFQRGTTFLHPPLVQVETAGGSWTEWHHVVAGFDGGSIFIQVDNGPRAFAPSPPVAGTPGGQLHVRGFESLQSPPQFANPIESTHDGLAVWADRALTEDDVAADWNGGDGLSFADITAFQPQLLDQLQAYWTFDGVIGTEPDIFEDEVQEPTGYLLEWSGPPQHFHTIVAGKLGEAVQIKDDTGSFPAAAGQYINTSDDFDFE